MLRRKLSHIQIFSITFHVQILSEVDAINDFCFNLDSFYKQLEVDKKLNELLFPANQCKIGVFVAAVYAHDNCWYKRPS